jgi:ABC-type nitrate/sulfonate/bicarbonate transport system substrate-binding protein
MNMKRFGRLVGGLLAAAALVASAAGGASAQETLESLKAKVQGKTLTLAFGAPPNLLEVQSVMLVDILKNEFGINASYQAVPADVSAAAVVSGSVNIGEVSLGRIAGLKQGGADVEIFASNDYINDFVIAAKAPIATIAELKGKVYGDSGSAGIGRVLREGCFGASGITTDDLQLVELGSSGATAQALATPQLDGGLIHADAAATLQAKFPGQYNVLCYAYEQVSAANDVWYSTKGFIDANPDLVLAVSVASMMASRAVYEDKAAWLAVANSYVPDLLPGVADATYDLYAKQIGLWNPTGALDMADCAANIDLLVKVAAIPEAVDCSTFLTTDFQTQAQAIAGPYTKPSTN